MKLRRIVAAIDASPHSNAALEAAAALAAAHNAELVGVFVEDTNLLRLAGLPFVREVIYPMAAGRPVDLLLMQGRLGQLAETARQALAECGSRHRVQWSFLNRRGSLFHEIIAAAEGADLLVIGKASHDRTRRVRLGSVATRLLSKAPLPVLVLQRGQACRGPPLLVCDTSPASLEVMKSALQFSRLFDSIAVVLILSETREDAAGVQQEIAGHSHLRKLQFRRCSPAETGGVARIHHQEETGVVIFAGWPEKLPLEALPAVLCPIDCPVLLYR
jgi:nucleotide-binding universal stress UspA family protein